MGTIHIEEAPAADSSIRGVFFGWDVNLTTLVSYHLTAHNKV